MPEIHMTQEIYLDANATSPGMPAAIEAAMLAMREGYGNPSSTHATGLRSPSSQGRCSPLNSVSASTLLFGSTCM